MSENDDFRDYIENPSHLHHFNTVLSDNGATGSFGPGMFNSVTRRIRGEPMTPSDDFLVSQDAEPTKFRPKVGLALGGGAARGWSHIGVLRALESVDLVPDVIAGTSIGALVGGCYLMDRLPQLEDFARDLTWRRIISLLDIGFGGSGLISGSKLTKRLMEASGDTRIEDLPKGFICVATELGTGHEIWLRSGPLVDAMRASYALPGIFQPVDIGGRWLVDGALVNPIPVSVCRAMGARVVIAVNLNTDVFGRGTTVMHPAPPSPSNALPDADFSTVLTGMTSAKKLLRRQLVGKSDGLPGISGVMIEAFNIIQDRISRSRLAGDPPDVTIGPKLGDIGLFDFHRAEESIAIGYETALRSVEEIREFIAALS